MQYGVKKPKYAFFKDHRARPGVGQPLHILLEQTFKISKTLVESL